MKKGFVVLGGLTLFLTAATSTLGQGPIGDALEAPELPWYSSEGAWEATTSPEAVQGGDMAVHADASVEYGWLATELTGPGNVEFWWNSASNQDMSFLFGELLGPIYTGGGTWDQILLQIPAGDHRLRWTSRPGAALDAFRFGTDSSFLGEALDNGSLFLAAEGDSWERITSEGTGGDALKSRGSGKVISLHSEVLGAGVLSFRWKHEGDQETFRLHFGSESISLSERNVWTTTEVDLPFGHHRLEWFYFPSDPTVDPAVYLDDLQWTPRPSEAAVAVDIEEHGDFLADPSWRVEPILGRDGTDALRVGPGHGETLVRGPGALAFWVKQVRPGNALLEVSGDYVITPSPLAEWQRVVVPIPSPDGLFFPSIKFGVTDHPGIQPEFLLDEFEFLPPIGLSEALDSDLSFTTNPGQPWIGIPAGGLRGEDYAYVATRWFSNSSSWLETEIQGPGTLLFDWRSSGQLNLLVNGVEVSRSRSSEWNDQAVSLPAGVNHLRWEFANRHFEGDLEGFAALDAIRLAEIDPDLTLASALGLDPSATISKTGDATPQAGAGRDGGNAVRLHADGGSTRVTVTLTLEEPVSLGFWAKVQNGILQFAVNEREVRRTTTEIPGWTQIETMLPPGSHTLVWEALEEAGPGLSWIEGLRLSPAVGLAEGLDTNLPIETGGDAPWLSFSLSGATHGENATTALLLEPNATSWLEFEVIGPGDLSFIWINEAADDSLEVSVDGVRLAVLLQDPSPWVDPDSLVVVSIPEGNHSLRLTLRNHGWRHAFSYIDRLQWHPSGHPLKSTNDLPADQSLVLSPYYAWSIIEGAGPDGDSVLGLDLTRATVGCLSLLANPESAYLSYSSFQPYTTLGWNHTAEVIADQRGPIKISATANPQVPSHERGNFLLSKLRVALPVPPSEALGTELEIQLSGPVLGFRDPAGTGYLVGSADNSVKTSLPAGKTLSFHAEGFHVLADEISHPLREDGGRHTIFNGGPEPMQLSWNSVRRLSDFDISEGSRIAEALGLGAGLDIVADKEWLVQNEVTQDGGAALAVAEDAALNVGVTATELLVASFWWRQSAADDSLRFLVNNRFVTLAERTREFTPGTWVREHVILKPGRHALSWSFHGEEGRDTVAYLDQIAFSPFPRSVPLSEALNDELHFITSDAAPWTGVSLEGTGVDERGEAVLSGDIPQSTEVSWIETSIDGPGTLRFRSRTFGPRFTSPRGFELSMTSGLQSWRFPAPKDSSLLPSRVDVPPGRHQIRWTVSGVGDGSGDRFVMLDDVVYERGTYDRFDEALAHPFPSPVYASVDLVEEAARGLVGVMPPASDGARIRWRDVIPLQISAWAKGQGSLWMDGCRPPLALLTPAWQRVTCMTSRPPFEIRADTIELARAEMMAGDFVVLDEIRTSSYRSIEDALDAYVPLESVHWAGFRSLSAQDGVDAAQSLFAYPLDETPTLSATLQGPGRLRFFWKAPAEPSPDDEPFAWEIPGVASGTLEGPTDWTEVTQAVPEGEHIVTWRAPGVTGFIDQLSFTPEDLPQSYEAWAASHGLESVDAAFDAVPNGAGVSNLYAYAFNLDPRTGRAVGPNELPVIDVTIEPHQGRFPMSSSDRMVIHYQRRRGAALDYQWENTSNLPHLRPPRFEVHEEVADLGNGMERVSLWEERLVRDGSHRISRIVVTPRSLD